MIFSIMSLSRSYQTDVRTLVLSTVRYRCYRRLFIAGVVVTADKLKINCRCHGIDENSGQYVNAGVNDTDHILSSVSLSPVNSGKHKVANISANFRKNSKRPQWDTQGKLIHENDL
jgi:hypothetical protein